MDFTTALAVLTITPIAYGWAAISLARWTVTRR